MFFGAIKFLVTFAIFADLNTRFLQAISIKHIFAKIATKICSKVLLRFAILVEFVISAIFAIFFYTFLTVHLILFAKIVKTICYQIFATEFNPGHKWRATR